MEIETISKIYRLVDNLDARGLLQYFSDDAVLLLGNEEPLHGKDEICDALDDLFAELDGVHHEIHDVWRPEGKTAGVYVSHADAYFRVRGCSGAVFVRGAFIFRVQNGAITCARVLYDLSPVREKIHSPDRVFEALDETFPASDAPAWMP